MAFPRQVFIVFKMSTTASTLSVWFNDAAGTACLAFPSTCWDDYLVAFFIFFPSAFRKCDLCVFVPLIVLPSVTEGSHSSCGRSKKQKYCFVQYHAILPGCFLLFQASVLMRDANPKQIGPSHQSKAKRWVGFLGPLPWKFHCLSRLPVRRFSKQIKETKQKVWKSAHRLTGSICAWQAMSNFHVSFIVHSTAFYSKTQSTLTVSLGQGQDALRQAQLKGDLFLKFLQCSGQHKRWNILKYQTWALR